MSIATGDLTAAEPSAGNGGPAPMAVSPSEKYSET